MTTIHDINDLVRLLRDQPEWAETLRSILLSEELLRLPEVVASLVKTTNAITEAVARLESRTERLEEGQARLEAGQARLESRADGVAERLDRMDSVISSMQGALGNLVASEYERWAAKLAPRRVRDQVAVTEGKVIQVSWEQPEAPELANALEQKSISSEDIEELLRADIIMRGTQHNDEVFLVIEASLTADGDDFGRARERAQILQRVTGTRTLPVVITERLSQDLDIDHPALPELGNVSLILLSPRGCSSSA